MFFSKAPDFPGPKEETSTHSVAPLQKQKYAPCLLASARAPGGWWVRLRCVCDRVRKSVCKIFVVHWVADYSKDLEFDRNNMPRCVLHVCLQIRTPARGTDSAKFCHCVKRMQEWFCFVLLSVSHFNGKFVSK